MQQSETAQGWEPSVMLWSFPTQRAEQDFDQYTAMRADELVMDEFNTGVGLTGISPQEAASLYEPWSPSGSAYRPLGISPYETSWQSREPAINAPSPRYALVPVSEELPQTTVIMGNATPGHFQTAQEDMISSHGNIGNGNERAIVGSQSVLPTTQEPVGSTSWDADERGLNLNTGDLVVIIGDDLHPAARKRRLRRQWRWQQLLDTGPIHLLHSMRRQLSDASALRLRSGGGGVLEATTSSSPLLPTVASEYRDAPSLAKGRAHSPKFHCPFDASCTVEFDAQNPDNSQLKDHCRTCHDPSISTCHWRRTNGARVCGERLKDLNGLLRHVAQVHLRFNTVVCPRCSQTLSRTDAFNLHYQKCR